MSESAGTQRAARKANNPEFQTHKVSPQAQAKMNEVTQWYDELLDNIKQHLPSGPQLNHVKSTLERACFYTIKGIAQQPQNQD
jgi:hypothetical protein